MSLTAGLRLKLLQAISLGKRIVMYCDCDCDDHFLTMFSTCMFHSFFNYVDEMVLFRSNLCCYYVAVST